MEFLPFTGYYVTMLIISILLDLLLPFLGIYWRFAFSFKRIKNNFEIWRIFTNFFVRPTRRINTGIIFDAIYLYTHIYNLEIDAKRNKKYSFFIMTLFILCISNEIILVIFVYIFKIKESRSLIKEILYSFMACSSYRNPDAKALISFIPIRNKYAPIATIILNAMNIEDLPKPIIGYISGYLFSILIDKTNIDITPNFLKRLCKEIIINENRTILNNIDDKKSSKSKELLMNINPNSTQNVALRNKESVIDGNEYKESKSKEIKWD